VKENNVMTLDDLINKTCLIGVTYVDTNGDALKTAQYAGTVVEVEKEKGIKVKLAAIEGSEPPKEKIPNFHLPPSLVAWYLAPKGHFKNAEHNIDIENPDYFVTWDVVKKKTILKKGSRSGGNGTHGRRRRL
jgi:hypothetical protein